MKAKIINLLLENQYIFDVDKIRVKDESLVDKNSLYKIYKRRLMISNKVSLGLINNIKLFKGDKIKLIYISDNKDEFLVFTDDAESTFIGIIKLT